MTKTVAEKERQIDSFRSKALVTELLEALGRAQKWAYRVSDELLEGEGNRQKFLDDMEFADNACARAKELQRIKL